VVLSGGRAVAKNLEAEQGGEEVAEPATVEDGALLAVLVALLARGALVRLVDGGAEDGVDGAADLTAAGAQHGLDEGQEERALLVAGVNGAGGQVEGVDADGTRGERDLLAAVQVDEVVVPTAAVDDDHVRLEGHELVGEHLHEERLPATGTPDHDAVPVVR